MLRLLTIALLFLLGHLIGYGLVNNSTLDYSKLGFISWIFTIIWYLLGLFVAVDWYQNDIN